jgi:PKD repeat protein
MKKLFYFFCLLWSCAYLSPLYAFTDSTCNAEFTYSASGHTVSFKSSPALPNTTMHWWTFGDATNSSERNPVHTYTYPGTYWVTHYILDSLTNCRDSFVRSVTVDSIPCTIQPKFTWQKDSANCLKVRFINQSLPTTSPNVHFIWKFGDGTSSTDVSPAHTYQHEGVYTVCLVMETDNGCRRETCMQVEVRCQTTCNLEAKFSFRIDTLNPLKVYFTNQTILTSSAAQFFWTFGDGTSSTEMNPVHQYTSPGTYQVCLKVMISNTCIASTCKTIVLGPQCTLQADFTWRFDSVQRNKVHFTSTVLSTATVVPHYKWTFGDGGTSVDANPTHVYQQPGTYKVCLVVEVGNCRKEICKQIVIQGETCNVRSKFEWRRDSSQWNKIWFANLSHPIQNIWRTSWTYGDGTSSQDFNSFHVYQLPGTYYVCLKVQSLNGCIDTYCDSVTVRRDSCENRSNFRFEPNSNDLLEYRFKPLFANPNFRYYWNFGDGASSTQMFPVHRYANRGTYKVCLTVVTSNTCRTTTCYEIKVGQNCDDVKLKFEYRRDSLKPYIISFHAVSNVPVVQQQWIITKMPTTVFPPPVPVVINANNPTYTFKDSGWYVVCLTAVTSNNCKKTYCEKIYIAKGENGRLITSAFLPVYPNPASSLVRLEVPVEVSTTLKLRVLDAAGVPKIQFSTPARAGNNYIVIPVEKLSNGLYMVEIRYGNQLKLAKFQKS